MYVYFNCWMSNRNGLGDTTFVEGYPRGSGYIYENLRITSGVKCYVKDNASGKCKRKSPTNTTESDLGVITKRKTASGSWSEENGRALITAGIILLWIWVWKWKTTITFFIVPTLDFLWVSLKNLLGWGDQHYETTITLGDEHPPNRRNRHRIFNYKPEHGWPGQEQVHGQPGHGNHGWEPERWLHKTKNAWHHPAHNLFEQPTYQYLPYGGEYALMGYDQHQAMKYRRTYKRKFDRFRQKYYRKKKRQVVKAQRARDREKKKAERRNRKAARRKHKLELFKERVQNWQEFWNSIQGNEGGGGDDDDDEAHDDNVDNGKTKAKGESKKKKKGEVGGNKKDEEHDDEEEDSKLKTKEENTKGKKRKKDEEEEEDEPEDDEESDDEEEGSWDEPSSDIEHGGPPPRKPVASSYHPSNDFDPLPSMSKNQKFIRIRLLRRR